MATEMVYFELSWSILSTIGITNVIFGVLVAGITSLSPVIIVPIVTSAAGAIANGLCYYAYYDLENPIMGRAVASIFSDLLWLVRTGKLEIGSMDSIDTNRQI